MEIHPEETVVIYTDGSQKPKPRRGGIGIVLCWHPHNQKADQLAKASAEMAHRPPLVPGNVRRKQSKKRLRKGTVPFEGQEITIHVHKGELMRPQRVNQFEFTVMTPGPLFENVGLATADPNISIREGHTYRVRLNDDEGNPEIVEVLMEVIEGGSETEPAEPN